MTDSGRLAPKAVESARSPGDQSATADPDLRPPTAEEGATLATLLSQPFQGRDALTEQLQAVRVRTIDADGSLELRPTGGPRADVVRRIPVEAETFDGEGAAVHLLLHVVEGQMNELEIYREDGTPPRGRLGELRILIL